MEARENKLQKLQISQNENLLTHDDFTFVFSIPVKLKFIFSGSHKKLFFLALLQLTDYIYSPSKV